MVQLHTVSTKPLPHVYACPKRGLGLTTPHAVVCLHYGLGVVDGTITHSFYYAPAICLCLS